MFAPKNLTTILAGFNRTIADLKELVDDHGEKMTYKKQRINALDIEIINHEEERSQAFAVLANLENLVKGK